MAERIEDRLWLPTARRLGVGQSDKIMHKGCGNRPSLFVKNDPDKFWCYCHRCHGGGHKEKVNQRVKQTLATKTGWKPEVLIPLVEAIVSQPYNFHDILARFRIAPYVSSLTFSPDTKRIYFPDDSGSLLGLDATGLANARFYSPTKRNLATKHVPGAVSLFITDSLERYLESVRGGFGDTILVMNREGSKAALADVSEHYQRYTTVELQGRLSSQFIRDLRIFRTPGAEWISY